MPFMGSVPCGLATPENHTIQTKAEPGLLCLVWLVLLPCHLAVIVSFDIKGLGWG